MKRQERWREQLQEWIVSDHPSDDGNWSMRCPLHEDRKPSAGIHFEKGMYNCFSCGFRGTITALLKEMNGHKEDGEERLLASFVDEDEVVDLDHYRKRRDGHAATLSIAAVKGWHEDLMDNNNRRVEIMNSRGLNTETLEKYLIGWDGKRREYTIPVFEDGDVVNVRRYNPDATDGPKIYNTKGFGSARLYPSSVLEQEGDMILLCEGEWDALVANQHGFPAITGTGGASVWRDEWTGRLKGRKVYVAYDNDDTGLTERKRVALKLSRAGLEVYLVDIPIDRKGADVSDYFVEEGLTAQDFQELLDDAPLFKKPKKDEVPESGEVVSVNVLDSFDSKLVGQPLEMLVTVTGKRNPPYTIPGSVLFTCTMDAGEKCRGCPMIDYDGEHKMRVAPNDRIILEIMDTSDKQKMDVLRQRLGAPKCGRLDADIEESHSVEELFVMTSVDEAEDDSRGDYTDRRLFNVGQHATETNQTVRVVGTTYPSPKNQRSEFISWRMEQLESSIDTFEVTEDIVELLERFKPSKKQSPLEKLEEISTDLSHNVTKIYGRDDLHMAMDLVWHSVIRFKFMDTTVSKGWLELLVIGDTRTGKSEAASRMINHYGGGKIISCESASFAGVVGGLNQKGNEWIVRWGAIPVNDRRLVILDEVGGLTTDDIAKLSSIRSSGRAELTKIISQTTNARTRLIWLANPRAGKINDYTYAIHAVPKLIGTPEDVARFDFSMSVAAGEVSGDVINKVTQNVVEHIYTPDACHASMLWAWSRKIGDVVWADGAEDKVLEVSRKLGHMYTEEPPLIQIANVRIKVARVAVALAARTFSTDDTHSKVIVRPEHVRDAARFLHDLYRKESFGYYQTSKETLDDLHIAESSKAEVKIYLKDHPGLSKFLRQTKGSFRRQDLEEMLDIMRDEANMILNYLFERRMVVKDKAQITIRPQLHEILREVKH